MRKSKPDNRRLLFAFDGEAMHQREILCITHNGDTGEVIYHCRPLQWKQTVASRFIRRIRNRKWEKRMSNFRLKNCDA